MAPPRSQFGPIGEEERTRLIARSPVKTAYEQTIDRESAYELLNKRQEELLKRREEQARQEAAEKEERKTSRASGGSRRESAGEAFMKSVARAVGSNLGRQIIRGILGSITGGKR